VTAVTREDRVFNVIVAGCTDMLVITVPEGKEEIKRDREDDDDPVVQPEVEPYTR
jgi:hypothetical protein